MLNWANFLHIYQPPEQDENIFHQVARESYFEIAKFFDVYDGINLTMNISGALLEQLVEYQYDALIDNFVKAFLNGEIEMAGSAMYHPILPLLPAKEIERQIILDEKIKKQIFGNEYQRRGFYLPEMAYSREVAEILDSMGFEWIILDEISFAGKLGKLEKGKVYKIKGLKLKVVFRDRMISDNFVPEKIKEMSDNLGNQDRYIITATDGELYGHHHHNFYDKTKAVFADGNIKSWKMSEFIKKFRDENLEEVEPVPSNWESKEEEIVQGNPFAYWNHSQNEIHKELWDFANFVIGEMEKSQDDQNYATARNFLDKGLSSCHFWAASGKKSAVWGELIWNPDVVERGSLFLIRAIRSLVHIETEKRMEAENKFLRITELVWKAHWNKFYNA